MASSLRRESGRPPVPAAEAVSQVARETLRARVYDQLRAAIMKGRFEPGQALTVRSLAAAFGVSPTPVREALQLLTAELALIAEPNKSYRVPMMTREHFVEVRDVRAALEGLAAQRAAERITRAEIRRLEQAEERMLRAIERQDAKTYLSANEDFHFTIYEAARAPYLFQMIRNLWLQIGPSLNLLFNDITLVESLNDNHRTALDALQTGDGARACEAIRRDILTAGAFVQEQVPQDAS